MKTFSITTIIATILFICSNEIQAQTKPTSPANINQFELMKQLHSNLPHEIKQSFDANKNQLPQGFENLQNPEILKTQKVNRLKSATADGQQLDSTITETWDTITSQWVVSGKTSYKYTFDANGNKTLLRENRWSKTTNLWNGSIIFESTYDAKGNKIIYEWKNGEKYESAYDANGNFLFGCSYLWDTTTSLWVGRGNKYEYIHGTTGNLTFIYIYTWDSITSQWVYWGKVEYSYNAKGYLTLVNPFCWDETNGIWISTNGPGHKEEYSYDENGRPILTIVCMNITENREWAPSIKKEYTYDANKLKTYASYQNGNWMSANVNWRLENKFEYTYDANGNTIVKITYGWDNDLVGKVEYFYDTNGLRILDINYVWEKTSSQWVSLNKHEFSYDKNGNNILEIAFSWDYTASQWIYSSKFEYVYDINGKKIEYSCYQNSDSTTTKWVCIEKIIYNDKGNTTFYYTNQNWSPNNESFEIKREYTYDSNGNLILFIPYQRDKNTSQWIEHYYHVVSEKPPVFNISVKQEYAYDADGNQTLEITYNWDETAHLFVYNTRTTWYYSDQSTNSILTIPRPHLTVYPNPAKDFVVFDLPNGSESATVELYDIQGKKVIQQKLTETKQIAVGNLPKGLYLYRLNDNETVYAGKLVVE